ncbi:hypothetical protein FE257_011013 [Aspergillus nanangensis]|uniref:S-adenosylmethionine-dependent methyltransferase-like protein n=1 Tax=Aspergillus nanangensis TaxID=2582783 RepID=A0AAD4CI50_ASPNN|nr:hypothetical protein FE257_011013 [Aspergillus nanangensis]
MPLFRKSKKVPPTDSGAFRSVEHLPLAPESSLHPDHPLSVSTNSNNNTNPNTNPSQDHPSSSSSAFFLRRSRSQRHPKPVGNHPPLPNDPSWPPSAANNKKKNNTNNNTTTDDDDNNNNNNNNSDNPENPRRSRRSLFAFNSSSSPNPSNDSVVYPERNQSLRQFSPAARRPHHQRPLSVDTTSDRAPASRSREYVLDSTQENTPQSPMPQDAARPPRSPHPPFIQRSHTDSLENLYRSSPVESTTSRHLTELTPGQPPFDPSGIRPPSRQSIGPPSPLRPLPNQPDSTTQSGGMSDRPAGSSQGQQPANQGTAPETGYRNSAGQQSEPGRSTPSSQRGRDEGETDLKTLIQKHDELQAKYSKVKRYYFEKDAQVQHLQNTVAHQRMAVSRTVLDDNEYANRFGRLDGAIKDLAFSIRKDWTSIPPWFNGYVNEDAHLAGTKEMMAIGRAVMSRWLVEELFERYFHPALEMTLSQQLKSIEMNLRRQQGKSHTEEDKENAIARISNWRRTTLDGLTDALQGPAPDEYRTQLTSRLVDSLVATLTNHLCDPPPPGLENAASMIVENAVGIADKIPMESRDICVEYVLPGTPVLESTMKIETGIKPLAGMSEASTVRASTDQERPDGVEEAEGDRESSGSTSQEGSRKRSVLSHFMGGRKQGAPAVAGGPGDAGRPAEERGPARVRLSSFVVAEVRGRGPMNVLVKAPVYLVE